MIHKLDSLITQNKKEYEIIVDSNVINGFSNEMRVLDFIECSLFGLDKDFLDTDIENEFVILGPEIGLTLWGKKGKNVIEILAILEDDRVFSV
jgi:hypothetical protein